MKPAFACMGLLSLARMKASLLSLAIALPFLASAQSSPNVEEMLRAELKKVQQDRKTVREETQEVLKILDEREREILAKLRKVEASLDKTKGISPICPTHNIKMRVERVPVAGGMKILDRNDPPWDVRQREFPFALDYFPGGCVTKDNLKAKVYICPDCQRADKQWRKTHPK